MNHYNNIDQSKLSKLSKSLKLNGLIEGSSGRPAGLLSPDKSPCVKCGYELECTIKGRLPLADGRVCCQLYEYENSISKSSISDIMSGYDHRLPGFHPDSPPPPPPATYGSSFGGISDVRLFSAVS